MVTATPKSDIEKSLNQFETLSQRIHGAGIFTYIDP